MKKFFFPLLALFLACCSPLYVPTLHNAPLLSKAGEFQGAMQYGSSGIDLQGALAVANHIAIMGNYSYQNVGDSSSSTHFNKDNYYNHTYYEAALGYYQNEDKLCYEIFAGYGKGESSNYDSYTFLNPTNEQIVNSKFYKYFIQPSIGIKHSIVHLAFSARISAINFTQFSTDNTIVNVNKEVKVFLEPGFTAKFNFLENHLFATVQAGFNTAITNDAYYRTRPYTIGTGIGFRIGGVKKKTDATASPTN